MSHRLRRQKAFGSGSEREGPLVVSNRFGAVVGIVRGAAHDAVHGSTRALKAAVTGIRTRASASMRRSGHRGSDASVAAAPATPVVATPRTVIAPPQPAVPPVPQPESVKASAVPKKTAEKTSKKAAPTSKAGGKAVTRAAAEKKAVPAKKTSAVRKSVPAKKTAAPKKAVPAKKAAPPKISPAETAPPDGPLQPLATLDIATESAAERPKDQKP